MLVRISLVFCLVVGASVSAASADDKPLMTRKGIEETCTTIDQSRAADLVTKQKSRELRDLLAWPSRGDNKKHPPTFDSLEKLDDRTYLVKVSALVRVDDPENGAYFSSEISELKYDELPSQRQEQLKCTWKLFRELSPIAEKIRAGGLPSLETTKAKIIDGSQVFRDARCVMTTSFTEIAGKESREKARRLLSLFEKSKWGSHVRLLQNNDGTTWVELSEDMGGETDIVFHKNTLVRFGDLDADAQQFFGREFVALSNEITHVAGKIRDELSSRVAEAEAARRSPRANRGREMNAQATSLPILPQRRSQRRRPPAPLRRRISSLVPRPWAIRSTRRRRVGRSFPACFPAGWRCGSRIRTASPSGSDYAPAAAVRISSCRPAAPSQPSFPMVSTKSTSNTPKTRKASIKATVLR